MAVVTRGADHLAKAEWADPMLGPHQQLSENTLGLNPDPAPLWQLDIAELAGHNVEARGREEVNRLLREGWILLHIYTLKYEEQGVWRERPMAILGKPRALKHHGEKATVLRGNGRRLRRKNR